MSSEDGDSEVGTPLDVSSVAVFSALSLCSTCVTLVVILAFKDFRRSAFARMMMWLLVFYMMWAFGILSSLGISACALTEYNTLCSVAVSVWTFNVAYHIWLQQEHGCV